MRHSLSQRGSLHVVIIVGLVLVLSATLGWVFWQNFTPKTANDTDTGLSAADLDDMIGQLKRMDCDVEAGLTEPSQVQVLDTTQYVDGVDIVSSDGTKQNVYDLENPIYGVADPTLNWVYLNGECGTSARAFLFNKQSESHWKFIAGTFSGSVSLDCADIEGFGVPTSFMPKCYDEASGKERRVEKDHRR